MHRGQHRDGFPGNVDAGEDAGRFGNPRQALLDNLGTQVLEMQMNMVLLGANAAAFANLDRHRARDDVTGSQVLGVGRVALHEGVRQIAALAAHALGDQAAGAVDPGRVELDELHVLHGQPGAQHHAAAIAGAGVRRGA